MSTSPKSGSTPAAPSDGAPSYPPEAPSSVHAKQPLDSPGVESRTRPIRIIAALSLLAFLLPLLVAVGSGTTTNKGVRDALNGSCKAWTPPEQPWEGVLNKLDEKIKSAAASGRLNPKVFLVRERLETLAAANDVQFRGFYPHIQMFLLPWMIAVLGSLLCWLTRTEKDPLTLPRSCVWGAVGLFAVVHGPHFVRAFNQLFSCDLSGRHIVSYLHLDVSPLGFLFDQGFFFVVCLIISRFCVLFEARRKTYKAPDTLPECLTEFSKAFADWQITSIALALAFLYLTTVYWRVIWKFHSIEHLPSAVLTHLLWALAWGYASMPLKQSWDAWTNARTEAVSKILHPLGANAMTAEVASSRLALLQELHPVGAWTVVGSVIVAVGSFAAPILQSLIEL